MPYTGHMSTGTSGHRTTGLRDVQAQLWDSNSQTQTHGENTLRETPGSGSGAGTAGQRNMQHGGSGSGTGTWKIHIETEAIRTSGFPARAGARSHMVHSAIRDGLTRRPAPHSTRTTCQPQPNSCHRLQSKAIHGSAQSNPPLRRKLDLLAGEKVHTISGGHIHRLDEDSGTRRTGRGRHSCNLENRPDKSI